MVEQIFIVGLIFGAARIFGGLLCGYLSYLAIKSIAFAGRDASAIESDDPFDFIGAFRTSPCWSLTRLTFVRRPKCLRSTKDKRRSSRHLRNAASTLFLRQNSTVT